MLRSIVGTGVRRVWLLAMFATACGSSDDEPSCNAPARTTYACEPVSTGTPGCVGGPTWNSDEFLIDSGSFHQDDVDLTFPSGCRAEIPDCGFFFQASPRSFVCHETRWAEEL